MRCKPGDLAVVVSAELRCNVGIIVRIIAPHDGAGALRFRHHGHVWLVTAPRRMTWYMHGKVYRRKTGPVPDNRLQPIRGLPQGQEFAGSRGEPVTCDTDYASPI